LLKYIKGLLNHSEKPRFNLEKLVSFNEGNYQRLYFRNNFLVKEAPGFHKYTGLAILEGETIVPDDSGIIIHEDGSRYCGGLSQGIYEGEGVLQTFE
jgi:hypothetical protein